MAADVTERLTPGEGRAPTDAEQLAIGTRVHRYIVLDAIGEGGMGTVYAAYDPNLDRKVALKVLHRRRLGEHQRALLVDEAKTLAKVRHPNVLAVHDLGAMSDGRLFMTTDLIEGSDAEAWSRAKQRTWREIRDIFVEAGRGLAAVHRANVVHRDLKPSNILVGANDHACVADFGIAAQTDDGDAVYAGTRAYMAPELTEGVAATPASDQCAFGLSLFEVLYGHRKGDAAPDGAPRKVPRFLRSAIARMTADDPAQRFPNMDAAVRALSADPRRRAGVITGIACAAVAIAAPMVFARQTSSAPGPCEDDPAALAGTWDTTRRAAVSAALAGTGSDVVDEALAGLDLYATEWRAGRRDACLATRVRGDQTEEVLSLRMECFARRRGAMDALVDALGDAGKLGAKNPLRAIAGLPSLAVCNDVSLLLSRAPLPKDHEQQRLIAAQEAELDELNAVSDLGQVPVSETSARAAAIAERAEQLHAPHVLARALMRKSDAEAGAAKIKTLQAAVVAALAARDYERVLGACRTLAVYLCNANRGDEMEFVAKLATASYDAAGQSPALERDRVWIDGSVGLCQSRPDLAIPAFSRVYELTVNHPLAYVRSNAAGAASNVASSLAYLERFDEALAWNNKAEAIVEQGRPDSNGVLSHFMTAWTALQAGDHATAERALDRADRGLALLADGGGELRCSLPMTRGMLALARDQRAPAAEQLAAATACFEQHEASDSIIAQLGIQARTELALATNAPDALALAQANLAIMTEDQADTRNAIAHALVGRAHLRANKLDEAAAEIARAEPFLAKETQRDERWALLAFARAELLLARGDAIGAATVAAEARELRAKRHHAFHVAELDALIARARR